MSELKIILNMEDKAGSILEGEDWSLPMTTARILALGCMPRGMASGKTSIGITMLGEDGKPIYAEMSLKMFQLAAVAFKARYGDETGDETVIIWDAEESK